MILRQKIAVWIGGALMLLVALWPPWYYVIDPGGARESREIRVGFLLAPPAPASPSDEFGYRVAWEIQILLWCVLGGLILGAVIALRERRGRISTAKKKRSARDGDVRRGRR